MRFNPFLSARPTRSSIIAFALFSSTAIHAADWLVKWPATVEPDAGEISVWLYATNPEATGESVFFPAQLTGTINGQGAITLQAVDPATSHEPVSLRSGTFERRQYRTAIEPLPTGPNLLALDNHGSAMLDVTAPVADEPAAPASRWRSLLSRLRFDQGMDPDASDDLLFGEHILPYEPVYFVYGDSPSGRFQFSFKYWLLDLEQVLPDAIPLRGRFNLAYTQTSLWDLSSPSAPFLDSSYRPELQFENRNLFRGDEHWISRLGFETGFQHESNGRDGAGSRSMNLGYLRASIVFGDEDDFHLTLQPRAWFYIGGLDGNPDIEDYRGHFDLRAKLGWTRGVELAGQLRAGDDLENHSALIELSYPLHELLNDSFPVYLYAQYFTGYGESLLFYNQRSEAFRVGIALYR